MASRWAQAGEFERAKERWRRYVRLVAVPAVVLTACLVVSDPAGALGQRGHSFAFAFPEAGSSVKLDEPAGIAVNEATGNVYVADRGNNRVEEFEPSGEHKFAAVKSLEVPYPVALAIDNSTEASDPSKGDVYVVGITAGELRELQKEGLEPEEFLIYKFNARGTLIAKIRKVKVKEGPGESFEEGFEAIRGIAVDQHGTLFVHNDEEMYEFDNSSKNKAIKHFETEGGDAKLGLAVDDEENIYAGVEEPIEATALEEELTEESEAEARGAGLTSVTGLFEFGVVAEFKGATDSEELPVELPELDPDFTTAVAVNTGSQAVNGVDEHDFVYVTNVGPGATGPLSTVAAFNAQHELVQRFALPKTGPKGQYGDGIAVDAKTSVIYVADREAGQIDAFEQEEPAGPTVSGLAACTLGGAAGCPVAAGSVELSAQVSPHGAATEYHFEYGSEVCAIEPSPCTTLAAKQAGESFEGVSVSEELEGLAAGTYHYRLVAKNTYGEASQEGTFTILSAAAGLPDDRQWQLVSPPQKEGNEPEPMSDSGSTLRASESGDAITYAADGPMGENIEGSRNPEFAQILSARGPSGWVTTDITTPNDKGTGIAPGKVPEYADFSPDLALALVEPYPSYARGGSLFAEPPLAPPVSEHEKEVALKGEEYLENTMYLRANPPLEPQATETANYQQALKDGALRGNAGYISLVNEANAPAVPFGGGSEAGKNKGVEFTQVATPDLSHGVFISRLAAPGAYEWGPSGAIQLISEIPEAAKASCAKSACQSVSGEQLYIGGEHERTQRNAISTNGQRIILTVGDDPGHLYLRDTATQETVELDAPQADAGEGVPNPMFDAASADLSKVFFTDTQRLTPESKASEDAPDLYVAELSGGEHENEPLVSTLTDLTPEGNDGESADVPAFNKHVEGGGVLGASEDGSYVYYAASGALAPEATRGACYDEAGTCNLYMRHYSDGEWQPAKLIAVLSGEDSPDWGIVEESGVGGDLAYMASRISPNGAYLAFMSNRSLTDYENRDRTSNEPDEEVYLYHATTGSLLCASCNPTGERPAGVLDELPAHGTVDETGEGDGLVVDRIGVWNQHWLGASLPGWTALSLQKATYQSRYLSNEGRLFFNSPDTLVPAVEREVNVEHKTSKEKVYEYEPDGLGSCRDAGGCIALISSAGAKHESAFLDASANGNDVFFLTAEKLVQQDTDESFDVYDAHVCEASSPCLPAPAGGSPECRSAEECREGSYGLPGYQSPASSGAGSGNGKGSHEVIGSKSSKKGQKPTLAQQLANALKGCRSKAGKGARAKCEKQARTKYEPLIRAQNLANALKACKKGKAGKRKVCEKAARKRYGPRRAKSAAHSAERSSGQ